MAFNYPERIYYTILSSGVKMKLEGGSCQPPTPVVHNRKSNVRSAYMYMYILKVSVLS